MPTEKEILERLAETEKEYELSKKSLAKAKKLLVAAETETINCKINLDKIKEELRVHRATIPSTHPEITLRDQEIIRFREDHPELVAMARHRDFENSMLCFSCEVETQKYITGLCESCHQIACQSDDRADKEASFCAKAKRRDMSKP